MAFIQNRLEWIKAQMPRAFKTVVNPNMEVKRLPPEEEPGAPGAYGGAGSIDGKIPGRFWINLRTTDLHSKYSLADLTFHEAIPGHIWQGEYTHEMPLIRQMLHVQRLLGRLGALRRAARRRARRVRERSGRAASDICSRSPSAPAVSSSTPVCTRSAGRASRACSSSSTTNGSNPLEVASEVDRYCSWPGQACGYKVGHSEINRQREKAKTALGSTFADKAFNDTLVLGGNVPLDVLAGNVDEYVRTAKT